MEWKQRHILDLDTWDRSELQYILEQTRSMDELLDRPIKKVPALRGKLVVNLFFEPSTRTRVSFELAEKFLSADVVNWSAPNSSTEKGETLRDTAWTLEAMGADAVVIRHGAVGAADYLARKLKKSVVYKESEDADAHRTQAHQNLYTAWRKLGVLEGRKMAIIGDVLHSRVARSNIIAFNRMGVRVVLSGPPTLMPKIPEALGATFTKDPVDAVRGADIVYLLRIQRERQIEGMFPSLDEYHQFFGVDDRLLGSASPDALVMHPGPINRRVEIASEVADGPRSMILGQVRSGVALRMALLFVCLGGVRQ